MFTLNLRAFWMWFDSPGHHKNMADLTGSALGIGENGVYWTQDFGMGSRVMLMSVEDRKSALATVR